MELVHNGGLLRGDVSGRGDVAGCGNVVDHGTVRGYRRPTAWTVFGDADAILAGDRLQTLALRLLAEDPHPASKAATARLTDCVAGARTGTGTGTGPLLGCACALGALYAGASEDDVEALDAFGREVGAGGRMARALGWLDGVVPERAAAEGLLALAEYVTRRGG